MRYTFGPINSRRFGRSLGIDLSPGTKSCTFDCLYCELAPAKPTGKIPDPPPPEPILHEVRQQLARFRDLDVLTITANGEPTLYPYLDQLIEGLHQIKGKSQLLILSNASRIINPSLRASLAKLDMVKLSLDCATQRCFQRLDRPMKGIKIQSIIQGMERFRQEYRGMLIIEILVVQGINDKESEFRALNEALQRIRPDRVDIGTIDRPPAYRVAPVTYQRLFELSRSIHNLPLAILTRHTDQTASPITLTSQELLHLLAHRPLSQEDVHILLAPETRNLLQELVNQGRVWLEQRGKISFYRAKSS
ncbi:MAG: radical SAM protein [Nitratiruptor sp.]|nr:radical SAM protein [Nitratiruptor sp.]NPA82901.1 radical SAM protein [Campylobacterota bacterium]